MTECPDCQAAAADRRHAIYRDSCKGCAARMLAASPLFWKARLTGKQFAEYRAALDATGVTHEQVKAAAMEVGPCRA